jgi:hypothetical protein
MIRRYLVVVAVPASCSLLFCLLVSSPPVEEASPEPHTYPVDLRSTSTRHWHCEEHVSSRCVASRDASVISSASDNAFNVTDTEATWKDIATLIS